MYETKTAVGRGYAVSYPYLLGEGCDRINEFYESLGKTAVQRFVEISASDGHTVCRCDFDADESEGLSVTVRLTLRRRGKRFGEKVLVHRWRRVRGEWLAVRG